MSLIQCDEPCNYQKDGYCKLDKLGTVNYNDKNCPYFKPFSGNDFNSFLKTSDTDKF